MVFYDIVEKKSRWYKFCRNLIGGFFKYIYYRKVYIKGRENLPPSGTPFMLLSNHQNGLMDALSILFSLPSHNIPIFLARADIFKKATVAKILNFCKILPVFRQRDGKEHLDENQEIFDFAARMINEGFVVSMFPEGQHQEGHYLGKVKKGFARIAFDAAEKNNFPADMLIIPVGNHYEKYRGYRSELQITFGSPIALSDYYELYKENPVKAMLELATEVEKRIRTIILDLPYPEYYTQIDLLKDIERPLETLSFSDSIEEDKQFASKLRQIPVEQVKKLCAEADELQKQIQALGFTVKELVAKYTKKALLEKALCLLIYFPFALYGFLANVLPIYVSNSKAELFSKSARSAMLYTTFHFVLDLLLTFISYIIYFVIFVIVVRPSILLCVLFLASLLIGKIAYTEYILIAKSFIRQCRAYKHRNDIKLIESVQSLRRDTSAFISPETIS